MKKGLLIAEKPSVKRDMQEAFSEIRNSVDFDLDFDNFVGHLMVLKYPKDYNEKWDVWNLDDLPIIPDKFEYNINKSSKGVFDQLVKKIKNNNYDFIINACDAGREGQAIFWTFYNHIGGKLPVKRIWVNDTTKEGLKKGFFNLLDEDTNEVLINYKTSSLLRMELDWLIGINLSRALSLKTNATVPVGRVMTPTLNIVAQRDLAIKNFVPKTTYEIEANFDNKYKGTWFNEEDNIKVFETEEKAKEFIKTLGKTGIVELVETKREKRNAPPNFALSDLQQEANNLYGYTAQETLDTAQSLYETHKILTYPRTDSKALSKNIAKEIKDHLLAIKDLDEVKEFAELIINDDKRINDTMNSKRYVDDTKLTDHHAIIPTKQKANLNNLSQMEKDIYLLVVKRFIATFLDPFLQDKTTLITTIDNEKFKTTGSVLVDLGFRKLYNYTKNDDELPKVNKGDKFNVVEINTNEKVSTPPPYFTDSTILEALKNAGKFIDDEKTESIEILKEVKGIGRDATRAGIIEKLIKDNLLYRKGRSIRATDFGLDIIKIVEDRIIASPELTAHWESKLLKIEDGEYDPNLFKDEMQEYVVEQINDIIKNVNTNLGQDKEFKVIGKCPSCNNDVIETKDYYLCTQYKGMDEDGCKFIVPKKMLGANINKKHINSILNNEKTDFIKFKNKDKKEFLSKLVFNVKNNKLEFAQGDNVGKCPLCGDDVIDRGLFYGCNGYATTQCSFGLPKKISGVTLDIDNIKKLINGEETDTFKFTWNSNSKGDAKLKYSKEEKKLNFIFPEREVITKCPHCNNNVLDFDSYVQCTSCGFSISKNISNGNITNENIVKLLNGEKTDLILFTWKSGNKSKAHLQYDKDNKKLNFIFPEKEVIGNCPKCNNQVSDYGTYVKCSSCDFSLSKNLLSASLTNKDIKDILEGKETRSMNFTWKNGKTNPAKLKYNKETNQLNFIFNNSNNEPKVFGKCPYCNSDIMDYKSFIRCSNKECNFSLSRKILGATLTEKDLNLLLSGKPSSVKNVTFKNGNSGKKRVQLTKDRKINFID